MTEQTPTDERARPAGLVVIGGSAGALDALVRIVDDLPTDLPAAVCIVIHVSSRGRTALAQILARVRGHDVAMAVEGEPLRAGSIRVAVPDRHLVIRDGHTSVSFAPRENRARPAIDPLFRTAARSFGPRCVSVVLSGALDDGAAGTLAVHLRGGLTIAQDPIEAVFPDMPANAIATGDVRLVLPVAEIGGRITDFVNDLAARKEPAGDGDQEDGRMASEELFTFPPELGTSEPGNRERPLASDSPRSIDPPGEPSPYSCPECGGVLWIVPGDVEHFRCRVGHRYTHEALDGEQDAVIEDALWTALRALEEQASLADRVAGRARARGDAALEQRFTDRRDDALWRAERIRDTLRQVGPSGGPVVPPRARDAVQPDPAEPPTSWPTGSAADPGTTSGEPSAVDT